MDLIFRKESYEIIGAGFDVHRELGHGFLESVYAEALQIELTKKNIAFKREVPLKINYKGTHLSKNFIADFLVDDKIIVELKAVSNLLPEHYAQVINYLRATQLKLGILLNFGYKSLQYKRIVL
ncbi:GxxExxY protein [Cecembia rubra]|jgi:GxxExxY protein|uniref:GxxExxY protein n=1 Tax=Cecembia rubra TaxID=1485585 RepID=UPI002714E924|nr:GxxExxY protein [Cecembia rubra]